jgi:2-C-methyl-D-erythritol 2,4-cyclodiphosphate synthase
LYRVGFGYDVHRLVEDRPLILGGVEIPNHAGLKGHSDADVLTHAVIDALLGALGLGDIGQHFPDTEPAYKDISSLHMLREVMILADREAFLVNNLDATIVAEKPKLASYIDSMKKKISGILDIATHQVNIKATTTEGLGFSGRGEGIAAYAIMSIIRRE